MSFTAPVDREVAAHIRAGATDWDAVADEFKQHPNEWRLLKVEQYIHCPYSRAKYAGARLRKRGLSVGYHEHYDEFENVPDVNGGTTTVRNMLGAYSVHAMARYSDADQS